MSSPKAGAAGPQGRGVGGGALPGQQVRENPDATLEEHRALFEEARGVRVSAASVSRALRRLGLPLKKVARSRRAR